MSNGVIAVNTSISRFLFGFGCLFLVNAELNAMTPAESFFIDEIVFPKNAVALDAAGREKVAAIVARARKEDWCLFEHAYIVAPTSLNQVEDSASADMTVKRVNYIVERIQNYGIPSSFILALPSQDTSTKKQYLSKIEVEFSGLYKNQNCPHPVKGNGFRYEDDMVLPKR
jgi:hypothetical protein